jgi:hypothetical protein
MPGMQEDAAARVDRDLEDVISKRLKPIGYQKGSNGPSCAINQSNDCAVNSMAWRGG